MSLQVEQKQTVVPNKIPLLRKPPASIRKSNEPISEWAQISKCRVRPTYHQSTHLM